MRTAASSFSLGSLFKGPSAAGGAVGGAVSSAVGGAVSGAANMLKGVSLEGIGTALLKIGKIATTVTALLLVLARVMGVEGKNGTEVLLNTLKIFVNIFKWVADIIITIVKSMASDIMKIVEDFKNIIDGIMNIFITIGDSINFLANLWNELFAGGPTDSLEKFKAKLSDVWGNWINQVNSTGFGAKDKDKNKEENKKYVFGGTTTTSSFAGLNRLAQDLADNTMLMAADKMDQAANKMDQAADKINNQWADHGPSNKPLVFNPSFATF
jgi:hypothetical protein